MNVIFSKHTFDEYYLRSGDIEPESDGSTLTCYDSDNKKSGNKWCKVNTEVIYNDDHLTACLCSWTCRHSGGQFWRFYRNGTRVTWKSLDDGERMLVLDGYDEKAPSWAKRPGKLTRDYLKPRELQRLEIDEQGTIYGYKYLRMDSDGSFHSIATRSHLIEWINGELEADCEPSESNTNGIYAMKSRKNPHLEQYWAKERVLVRLALSGTVIEANEGLRAQHAQIVEVL